jgi:hypothetical protein
VGLGAPRICFLAGLAGSSRETWRKKETTFASRRSPSAVVQPSSVSGSGSAHGRGVGPLAGKPAVTQKGAPHTQLCRPVQLGTARDLRCTTSCSLPDKPRELRARTCRGIRWKFPWFPVVDVGFGSPGGPSEGSILNIASGLVDQLLPFVGCETPLGPSPNFFAELAQSWRA